MAQPKKRSNIDLTEENVRMLEHLLPKLKYQTYISHVKRWLENFDKEDIKYAYDFLFYIEYITFPELQYRIVEHLNPIIKSHSEDTRFLFVPFAKYGKSCDMVIYLITHTMLYKNLEAKQRARCIRTIDVETKIFKDEVVIFVDDFIGTGKSFDRDFKKKELLAYRLLHEYEHLISSIYLVAAVIMQQAVELIKFKFPEIKLVGEYRSRIFCPSSSPFRIGFGPAKMKAIAYKYGNSIRTNSFSPKYQPMGYSNTEALIAFDYATPNNTLPIIWGDHKWYPIFPRIAETRMDKAKAIKTEVAFYIGIMNRLKLDLYEDKSIGGKNKRAILYNHRIDHSLLTVIFLKSRKYHDLIICQILGITTNELLKIKSYGIERKLLDNSFDLTVNGNQFLHRLKREARQKKFSGTIQQDYEPKNYIYIPNQFKGIA